MIAAPQSNREQFIATAQKAVDAFGSNPVFARIHANTFGPADYRQWLRTIFHQTYQGPATFALAGANCDSRHCAIREYLIEHADEEKSHWQWVLEDLRNMGDDKSDPRAELPPLATQNYLSFNVYLAVRVPIARLGTAAVLEGIGATYSKRMADKMTQAMGISARELKFIYGHGDTDVGHTEDIFRVLSEADLSSYDWAWLTYAAQAGGQLYRQMYEAAVA